MGLCSDIVVYRVICCVRGVFMIKKQWYETIFPKNLADSTVNLLYNKNYLTIRKHVLQKVVAVKTNILYIEELG